VGAAPELAPKDQVSSPDRGTQDTTSLAQISKVSAATQESEAAASETATRDFTRVALLTLVVIQVAWMSFLTYLAVGLIL
jgi:uncharacterized membrane protein YadS